MSAGKWIITDSQGRQIDVDDLDDGAVAYDESGFSIDLADISDRPDALADAGYFPRPYRRILIWATAEDSVDDDGSRAIASAQWVE